MATKKNNKKNDKKTAFDKKERIESLILYFVIVNRDQSKYFIDEFNKVGISMHMVLYGYSDPPIEYVNLIGPDISKKDILLSFCKYSDVSMIHEIIENKFKISKLAKGIAFGVPIDSVAGVAVYKFLVDYNKRRINDEIK